MSDQKGAKPADTGNASNPSPGAVKQVGKGILDPKAEKYLKEGGNIEDMPDAEEQKQAEDEMEGEKDKT